MEVGEQLVGRRHRLPRYDGCVYALDANLNERDVTSFRSTVRTRRLPDNNIILFGIEMIGNICDPSVQNKSHVAEKKSVFHMCRKRRRWALI